MTSLDERLDEKWVIWPATGCRLWMASCNRQGYGQIRVGGRNGRLKLAHRVAYELDVGDIPDGHDVDHVKARGCVGPPCVWWEHLEAVTHLENVRRGNAAAATVARNLTRTYCVNGHPYDGQNTYNRPGGRPGRNCRKCVAQRMRDLRERRNE